MQGFTVEKINGSGRWYAGSLQPPREVFIPNRSQFLSHIIFAVVDAFKNFEGTSCFCLKMKIRGKSVSKAISRSLKLAEGQIFGQSAKFGERNMKSSSPRHLSVRNAGIRTFPFS